MERNVLLLYMSPFGKNPNIHTQTNEAAVLELKKHKEGPDCILALIRRSSGQSLCCWEKLKRKIPYPLIFPAACGTRRCFW